MRWFLNISYGIESADSSYIMGYKAFFGQQSNRIRFKPDNFDGWLTEKLILQVKSCNSLNILVEPVKKCIRSCRTTSLLICYECLSPTTDSTNTCHRFLSTAVRLDKNQQLTTTWQVRNRLCISKTVWNFFIERYSDKAKPKLQLDVKAALRFSDIKEY